MTSMFLAALVLQIAYGGLTAGLKAGYISDTWPKMGGSILPANLFRSFGDAIDSPLTVMFIHRWFAFVVATIAIGTTTIVLRNRRDRESRTLAVALVGGIGLQIVLGITTVLTSVAEPVALAHQATAIGIFAVAVSLLHRIRSMDASTRRSVPLSGNGPINAETEPLPVLLHR